jgi:hypothetical protein
MKEIAPSRALGWRAMRVECLIRNIIIKAAHLVRGKRAKSLQVESSPGYLTTSTRTQVKVVIQPSKARFQTL